MKFYKIIITILIVFFKTGNLLSENNLFNVNNIQLEKKDKISIKNLANNAIKKGFTQLLSRILLSEDKSKLMNLELKAIKELVSFYQTSATFDEKKNQELVNFSITFDKTKIHDLFYRKGILYSEILDKELFILPILVQDNEIFIYNNNFFYQNWNKFHTDSLIEFILPLENIEIINQINRNKNNLINIEIESIFKEYSDKNLALILIDGDKKITKNVYIKSIIQKKKISKNLTFKNKIKENVIIETKQELINLVKSENLIDIRTPYFLNVKFELNRKNNLVELNARLKKIDLIENVSVLEFNKDNMSLRIKYLGKLQKIIDQLNKESIQLELINDQWKIKTL